LRPASGWNSDFDGERGRESEHIESVCVVSPGNGYFQYPLGRRELGPVTVGDVVIGIDASILGWHDAGWGFRYGQVDINRDL